MNNTSIFSIGWLESSFDVISQALVPILAWLLFPIIFPALLLLFQDSIVIKTCKAFYPNTEIGKNPNSLSSTILHDMKFLVISLIVNILLLPFYLIPLVNVILYVAVNGFLIGRECFDIAAGRFVTWENVDNHRRNKRGIIYLHGIAITLLALIPFINLITPLIALIVMVHLYKRQQQ